MDATQLRRDLGLLTEEEVAVVLGKEVSTLQNMRSARTGPPWLKAGRSVLYRRASFEAWLADQEARTSGPDPRVAGGYTGAASPTSDAR